MKKKKIDIHMIKDEAVEAFQKAKTGLKKIGKETAVFAKRGEKEFAKFTKVGKAEVGILSLNIKKNRLYYEIGKKVYGMSQKGRLSTRNLKKLCNQIGKVDKELKNKKRSVSTYLKKYR